MRTLSVCVALLLLVSTQVLSSHALADVSIACPDLLTSSSIKNYKRPASDDTLLVVVPWKVGFEQFVHFNPDTCLLDGYSIQVFLQALRHMQPHKPFPYRFVLHGNGTETPIYEDMIEMVANRSVDAVVADLTITSERMQKVAFTMPYLPTSLTMVTTFQYGSAGTLWDFLKPFSVPLWLTLLASFVCTGAALYFLENRNPDFSKPRAAAPSPDSSIHGLSGRTDASSYFSESPRGLSGRIDSTFDPSVDPSSLQRPGHPIYDQASHKRRLLNAFWFTSLCVFQTQEESVRTHLGRFVTVMWLFVMLIFNSSYTASLTSLLSAQKMYPSIEGFQALLNDTNISVGYQPCSFMSEYMKNIQIKKDRLRPYSSAKDYINALKEGNGKPGRVGAVLDELPYVQILLQSECFFTKDPADFDLPSWGGFAFAFHNSSNVTVELSKTIVAMQEDKTLQRLQNGWGIGGAKSDRCSSVEKPSHLRLRSFGGLLCILCGVYVFSIVWRLSTTAVGSMKEMCLNVLACATRGYNACRRVPFGRRSNRVTPGVVEISDAGLEHSDAGAQTE